MARRIAVPSRGARSQRALPGHVDEGNIDSVEEETLEKVGKTLSALELALASWDAAKEKPESLRPKFAKYRLLHDMLIQWQKKAQRAAGKKAAFEKKVAVLWDFVDICRDYS